MKTIKILQNYAFILALLAGACASPLPGQPGASLTETKTSNPGANDADSSEILADEGEALLLPETLDRAREKFRLSVEKNAENARALFWLSLSDLFLEMKGIVLRVKPVYLRLPDGEKRYEAFAQRFSSQASSGPGRIFFQRTQTSIQTGHELNEWMDRVRLRLINLRTTIRKIRDIEITISLPRGLIANTNFEGREGCGLLSFGPVRFRPGEDLCFEGGSGSIGINRADYDVIASALAVNQIMLELWTAYSMNPEALLLSFDDHIESREAAERFVKNLFTRGHDGRLTRPEPLTGIKELAADTVLALRHELENQRELCPLGYTHPDNRKGYLVAVGRCLPVAGSRNYQYRQIEAFEAFVNGQPVDFGEGKRVNFTRLFKNAPKNIKEIMPFEFDECGNLLTFNTKPFEPYLENVTFRRATPDCQRGTR